MPTNIPRPLPKPGEPGYQEPGIPRLASPPPPRRRDSVMDVRMVGGMTRSVLPQSHDELVRSDERKRLLLERVLKAMDGIDLRHQVLLEDIRTELSRG